MKFKAGDEVKHKTTGKVEIVESVPGMYEYDKLPFASAEQGFTTKSGWRFRKDWKKVKKSNNP